MATEEAYRLQQVDKLVGEINPAVAAEWLAVIKRCAATRSNDSAAFLTFIEFLKRLARAQPPIVFGYLQDVLPELKGFLNDLLDELDDGASAAEAQALMQSWIAANLPQVGRHLRLARTVDEKLVRTPRGKGARDGEPRRRSSKPSLMMIITGSWEAGWSINI